MNFRLGWCYFRVGTIAIFLALVAPIAMADDVRPVQILVKELPSGAFDIQWSVPKVIPPQAMPSPRLPEQCSRWKARDERSVKLQAGGCKWQR